MGKTVSKCFADTLPPTFRRACSVMSGDGGFKGWLDERFGAGKWALCDYPRGEIEKAISNPEMSELAAEYGYQRLTKIFATLDPVTTASVTPHERDGASQ